MSKEMTPKDALDNLVHCKSELKCPTCKHKSRCTMERDYNIINQALDSLELLEKENQGLKNKNAALKIKVRAWEIQGGKLKKVIEILKDKLCVRKGTLSFARDSYYLGVKGSFKDIKELTQQEYDLLKEVLENV